MAGSLLGKASKSPTLRDKLSRIQRARKAEGGLIKRKLDVEEEKRLIRKDPEFQKELKEAEKLGYWDREKDPEGDIHAVHKYLFDKNAPERKRKEEELYKQRGNR